MGVCTARWRRAALSGVEEDWSWARELAMEAGEGRSRRSKRSEGDMVMLPESTADSSWGKRVMRSEGWSRPS